jgi:hypothetical protein|eukprot:evm.model.NODE_39996_length_24202_cov_37.737171.2
MIQEDRIEEASIREGGKAVLSLVPLPYLRISRKCLALPTPSAEMCISMSLLFGLPLSPSLPSSSPFSSTTTEEGEEEDEVEEEKEEGLRKKAYSFIN